MTTSASQTPTCISTGWKVDVFEPMNMTPIGTLYAPTEDECLMAAFQTFGHRQDVTLQTTDISAGVDSHQVMCVECGDAIVGMFATTTLVSGTCECCASKYQTTDKLSCIDDVSFIEVGHE